MMAVKIMEFIKCAQIWIEKMTTYPLRAIYGFLLFILDEIMGVWHRVNATLSILLRKGHIYLIRHRKAIIIIAMAIFTHRHYRNTKTIKIRKSSIIPEK